MWMLGVYLFIKIAQKKSGKNERKQICYIYSMEYCLSIENNELQIFLATCMYLKSARLSKRSQIHIQTTYCISSVQSLSRV